MRNKNALHSQVDALVCYLYTRANYLNRKCCSVNKTTHWKARGSQQTLRSIARHLAAMRAQYHKRVALVLALQNYLHCLETSTADAEEEARQSRPNRNATTIERWKAEGELQVLPGICASLSDLVHRYAPTNIFHTLSPDGESLVPLYET